MAKTAAERKAKQREREAREREERRIKLEPGKIEFEFCRGDREALSRLMQAGGFEEYEEVVTTLIHIADRAIKCDSHAKDIYLDVSQLRQVES